MRRLHTWQLVTLGIIGGLLTVLVLLFFSGSTQVADEALQYQLHALGESVYEYHASTGSWPDSPEDLARTSLPVRLRYWRSVLENRSMVVVWPHNLDPNPLKNSGVVLAYHARGLRAQLGRQWVCWGDLRTEYISSKRLQAVLARQQ